MLMLAGIAFCFGFPVFLGVWMKRRSRILDLGIVCAVAVLLPIAFIAETALLKCEPVSPSDPCDAPAMLFVGMVLVSPIIWLVGIVIGGFGFLIGRRAHSDNRDLNKLDLIDLS